MHGPVLLERLRRRQAEMLESIAALVRHESPSQDKGALDVLARVLADQLRALGADVGRIPNAAGGDHVRAWFGFGTAAGAGAAPALVLGHFDTVWPAGTVSRRPFRIEEGRAYGPGVFDMKASLVLVEFAFRTMAELGLRPPRPVVVLLTSDEEIGSPTSRATIEAEARRAAYALVLEPPLPGGRLKTARKGVGRFDLEIKGRAAHAGIEPEKGISAIVELAHQILRIQSLADPKAGSTVNVGVVEGGTTPNVVPAHAAARIDVRVTRRDEARRIEEAMQSLAPAIPGAGVTARGGFNRPPMERTDEIGALFERARVVGRSLGLELAEGSTGGASDGNFTAAIGLPTLDGLGALGAGAHAEDEQVEVDSLPERAALLAALLLGL